MNKHLLFTPGPVNVAENVRAAICKEDICHREVDFDELLLSIEDKLLKLLQIRNTKDYRAVVITGSGTAANESILSSVVGDKNILILSNGEFGERLHNISSVHNINTHLLNFAWGESIDIEKVEAYLKDHHIDVLAMVHHETSSGMLNPLEEIGSICKAHSALFLVDCVSSAGAEVIDIEKCHITFCSSSSSKAIGSYSGLSFVVGRVDEFEKLRDHPAKTVYLNLYSFYSFIKNYSQTPNTPAVHLFFAFEQALENILTEGVDIRFANIARKAKRLRRGMQKLGFKFLLDQNKMSSILTTVYLPSYINVSDLRAHLREQSIIIYEGKGCFKGKVFQVGNIGELSGRNIQFFLDTLKVVLFRYQRAKKNTLISAKSPAFNVAPGMAVVNSVPELAAIKVTPETVAI